MTSCIELIHQIYYPQDLDYFCVSRPRSQPTRGHNHPATYYFPNFSISNGSFFSTLTTTLSFPSSYYFLFSFHLLFFSFLPFFSSSHFIFTLIYPRKWTNGGCITLAQVDYVTPKKQREANGTMRVVNGRFHVLSFSHTSRHHALVETPSWLALVAAALSNDTMITYVK